MHAKTWIIFLWFLEVFMHSRKGPPKKEHTKLSVKSSRFVSSNHFENGLISNISEQRSLNCWLEADLISGSNNWNLWHQPVFARNGKISDYSLKLILVMSFKFWNRYFQETPITGCFQVVWSSPCVLFTKRKLVLFQTCDVHQGGFRKIRKCKSDKLYLRQTVSDFQTTFNLIIFFDLSFFLWVVSPLFFQINCLNVAKYTDRHTNTYTKNYRYPMHF